MSALLILGACKQQPPATQAPATGAKEVTEVQATDTTTSTGTDLSNNNTTKNTTRSGTISTSNVVEKIADRRTYPTTKEFKSDLARLARQDFAKRSEAEKAQVIGRILKALGTIKVEGSTIDLKNVHVRGDSVIIPGINMNNLPPRFTQDAFSLAFFGDCVKAAGQNRVPPLANNFSLKFYDEGSLAFTFQGPSNDP